MYKVSHELGRKKGNVLFTFYLFIYSNSKRWNLLLPLHGLLLLISSKGPLFIQVMEHWVEREIDKGVHHGSNTSLLCQHWTWKKIPLVHWQGWNSGSALEGNSHIRGARYSSAVNAFAHGVMGHRIHPSWWTHWAISRSSQCSMTGVTKAMVCVVQPVRWFI